MSRLVAEGMDVAEVLSAVRIDDDCRVQRRQLI
jgi:hypothetical protein